MLINFPKIVEAQFSQLILSAAYRYHNSQLPFSRYT
jgi:hypothetical protein